MLAMNSRERCKHSLSSTSHRKNRCDISNLWKVLTGFWLVICVILFILVGKLEWLMRDQWDCFSWKSYYFYLLSLHWNNLSTYIINGGISIIITTILQLYFYQHNSIIVRAPTLIASLRGKRTNYYSTSSTIGLINYLSLFRPCSPLSNMPVNSSMNSGLVEILLYRSHSVKSTWWYKWLSRQTRLQLVKIGKLWP